MGLFSFFAMKKIICIITCLTLTLGLSLPVLADSDSYVNSYFGFGYVNDYVTSGSNRNPDGSVSSWTPFYSENSVVGNSIVSRFGYNRSYDSFKVESKANIDYKLRIGETYSLVGTVKLTVTPEAYPQFTQLVIGVGKEFFVVLRESDFASSAVNYTVTFDINRQFEAESETDWRNLNLRFDFASALSGSSDFVLEISAFSIVPADNVSVSNVLYNRLESAYTDSDPIDTPFPVGSISYLHSTQYYFGKDTARFNYVLNLASSKPVNLVVGQPYRIYGNITVDYGANTVPWVRMRIGNVDAELVGGSDDSYQIYSFSTEQGIFRGDANILTIVFEYPSGVPIYTPDDFVVFVGEFTFVYDAFIDGSILDYYDSEEALLEEVGAIYTSLDGIFGQTETILESYSAPFAFLRFGFDTFLDWSFLRHLIIVVFSVGAVLIFFKVV